MTYKNIQERIKKLKERIKSYEEEKRTHKLNKYQNDSYWMIQAELEGIEFSRKQTLEEVREKIEEVKRNEIPCYDTNSPCPLCRRDLKIINKILEKIK